MNFIRKEIVILVANQLYGNYKKNTIFQLNISKTVPARKKHRDMGCEYCYNNTSTLILNV